MQEEEIELDIYYQGSSQELLSLLYPLHSPASQHFNKLKLNKIMYQPKQQSLQMRYLPSEVQNTDNIQKEIVYQSRKINNRTNYFYSILNQEKNAIVWRNINNFLQMRPTQQQPYKAPQIKTTGYFQRRYQSYDQVMTTLTSEAKQELTYHGPYNQSNHIHQNMRKAVENHLNKNSWRYTKDQYRRSLST